MAHRSCTHPRVTALWAATIATILSLMLAHQVSAVPLAFTWGSYDASGDTAYGVYEIDTVTPLSTGDLVQLIWAGPDGLIDPPSVDGTPGGDDVILDSTTVQNRGTLPPPALDRGYVPFKVYSYDTEDPETGGVVYLRAWNAPSVSGDDAYGDSQISVLTVNGVYNALRWSVTGEPTPVQVLGLSHDPGASPRMVVIAGSSFAVAVTLAMSIVLRRVQKGLAGD